MYFLRDVVYGLDSFCHNFVVGLDSTSDFADFASHSHRSGSPITFLLHILCKIRLDILVFFSSLRCPHISRASPLSVTLACLFVDHSSRLF